MGEIVSEWLFEDRCLKRKLRRNKRQIFEELTTHGLKESCGTVCYFIDDWKNSHHENIHEDGFDRLEYPPGEAQVDFGVMETVKDGAFVDVQYIGDVFSLQ